jgi:fructose-specific phosphotransferase system IIB component
MKIVAVTSCITGIAHTYMAAEALDQAAKKAGHEITVETQGSAGSTPIPQKTIDAAEVIIFACDLEVKNKSRFNGKPFLQVGVTKVLADADSVIRQATDSLSSGKAPRLNVAPDKNVPAAPKGQSSSRSGFFARLFGRS